MEDILASIKRIIAEDGDASARSNGSAAEPARASRGYDDDDDDADILELTRPIDPLPGSFASALAQASAGGADVPSAKETAMPEAQSDPQVPNTRTAAEILSPKTADASRQALAALSAMVIRPDAGANTLEGLVSELLRPMLREWLDAELPAIVERLVSGEIARISGRPG